MLRTVTNKLSSIGELRLNVKALDWDLTRGWSYISSQTFERGRFTSTIDSKQGKTLTIVKAESCLFNGFNWSTTECVILLLEVADSDAVMGIAIISLGLNTFLFCHNIVIFRWFESSSLRILWAASKSGTPIEKRIYLELNKSKQYYADKEM